MEKKLIIEAVLRDYRYSNKLLVDGRKTTTKEAITIGLTKEDIAKMRITRFKRMGARIDSNNIDIMSHERRASFLKMVNECKFDLEAKSSRYNCTGIDWKAYHRPSSSGGWVLIAPDEPGNNWHTNDPIIVKYLRNKFLNH